MPLCMTSLKQETSTIFSASFNMLHCLCPLNDLTHCTWKIFYFLCTLNQSLPQAKVCFSLDRAKDGWIDFPSPSLSACAKKYKMARVLKCPKVLSLLQWKQSLTLTLHFLLNDSNFKEQTKQNWHRTSILCSLAASFQFAKPRLTAKSFVSVDLAIAI